MLKYLGGKSYICREIAYVLKSLRKEDQIYIEPFVGGAWVLCQMDGVRIASDINRHLISFYEAVSKGWLPPRKISEETYRSMKLRPQNFPPEEVAFAAIGCSFAGKWFGGYARGREGDYAAECLRSVKKHSKALRGVQFLSTSYDRIHPTDSLIYCDPPYKSTTGYTAGGVFNHTKFWNVVRKWSERNTVIVSEYQAPHDFECIAEFPVRLSLRSKTGSETRMERLFKLSED